MGLKAVLLRRVGGGEDCEAREQGAEDRAQAPSKMPAQKELHAVAIGPGAVMMTTLISTLTPLSPYSDSDSDSYAYSYAYSDSYSHSYSHSATRVLSLILIPHTTALIPILILPPVCFL
jgi:hypothetical protein